jgi:hypothetical protein
LSHTVFLSTTAGTTGTNWYKFKAVDFFKIDQNLFFDSNNDDNNNNNDNDVNDNSSGYNDKNFSPSMKYSSTSSKSSFTSHIKQVNNHYHHHQVLNLKFIGDQNNGSSFSLYTYVKIFYSM